MNTCFYNYNDITLLYIISAFLSLSLLPTISTINQKVVRVSLATIRNLVKIDEDDQDVISSSITNTLIGCGLTKSLINLKDRSWADKDVAEDVQGMVI